MYVAIVTQSMNHIAEYELFVKSFHIRMYVHSIVQ